jgi:conjugal transfer mating pair stabilization protein TraG
VIVPTTTVVVSDTINPTVGNGAVANVPIGLAMVASFSSQVNNWLTKTAESVFTMPSALTYSAGGMIYPTGSTISPAIHDRRSDHEGQCRRLSGAMHLL